VLDLSKFSNLDTFLRSGELEPATYIDEAKAASQLQASDKLSDELYSYLFEQEEASEIADVEAITDSSLANHSEADDPVAAEIDAFLHEIEGLELTGGIEMLN